MCCGGSENSHKDEGVKKKPNVEEELCQVGALVIVMKHLSHIVDFLKEYGSIGQKFHMKRACFWFVRFDKVKIV